MFATAASYSTIRKCGLAATTAVMAALMTATSVSASGRQLDRKNHRTPFPKPERTFKRDIVQLGMLDDCFGYEAGDLEPDRPVGLAKVTCRSKCPPDYGTNETHCVWKESFTPFRRVLRLMGSRDNCFDDNATDPESQARYQRDGQLVETWGQVDQGTGYRRTCTAKCLPGYPMDNKGHCIYQKSFETHWAPAETVDCRPVPGGHLCKLRCPDHDDWIEKKCYRKCPEPYVRSQTDPLWCMWPGEKQSTATPAAKNATMNRGGANVDKRRP